MALTVSSFNSHPRTLGGLCYAMGLKGRYVCMPFETNNEYETTSTRFCAYQNLPENQCVFIRGFRVFRSFWMMPRRLKAAAGPSSDPGGYDGNTDAELISLSPFTTVKDSILIFSIFSDVLKCRDPLHLLLDYIAEVSTSLVSSLCIPQYVRS